MLEITLSDDEVDALQTAIEEYLGSLSQLSLQLNPPLRDIVKNLESAGLKLGMEME